MSTRPQVFSVYSIPHKGGIERIDTVADFRVATDDSIETIVEEAQGAVALIASSGVNIDGSVLDRLPTLKILSSYGAGADCFDLAAATARGIAVMNNAGVAPTAVAEFVIGTLLVLRKGLRRAEDYLRRGGRDLPPSRYFGGHDMAATVLGIVGFGSIGRAVAVRAVALGAKVIACDPIADEGSFFDPIERVELQDLLRQSDAVTIHVPLTDTTKGLIGASEFALMREGAILINSARGGIVDENAMVDALRTGRLEGAAVDVFDDEPPPSDHPIFLCENVIVTPHVAGITSETQGRLSLGVAENVLDALSGRRPERLMNPSVWPITL